MSTTDLGRVLTADELKGLGDRDYVVHPRRDRKSLDFMASAAATAATMVRSVPA